MLVSPLRYQLFKLCKQRLGQQGRAIFTTLAAAYHQPVQIKIHILDA